jgi:ribosome-associated protein
LVAARAADDGLGIDTVVLDVGPVLAVTDYFVITSGENARQVKAIVDAVEETVAEQCGVRPTRVEGLESLEWVLLDYGTFVVHVFASEQRTFYKLERLWSDCERVALIAS